MRAELKLIPPKIGRTPFFRIRGTYLGCRVDRSAKTGDRATAKKILDKIRREIERGEFAEPKGPTFAGAAAAYMMAGGERRFMAPILVQIGTKPLDKIDQATIDKAAMAICPDVTAATRNREVYTPVSAVLRHAGVHLPIRRPRGAQGNRREFWLKPPEAHALLAAAWDHHPRFGALCTFLLYTGCRLSEALRLTPRDCDLEHAYVEIGKTKTGEPRGAHLPPIVVAALRRCLMERVNPKYAARTEPRSEGTVFALTKSGHLYGMLKAVEANAGVEIADDVAFHAFRHTYGAWMRRYGRVNLHETGAWTSRAGARAYDHYDVSEAARAADQLPGATEGATPGLKSMGEG